MTKLPCRSIEVCEFMTCDSRMLLIFDHSRPCSLTGISRSSVHSRARIVFRICQSTPYVGSPTTSQNAYAYRDLLFARLTCINHGHIAFLCNDFCDGSPVDKLNCWAIPGDVESDQMRSSTLTLLQVPISRPYGRHRCKHWNSDRRPYQDH